MTKKFFIPGIIIALLIAGQLDQNDREQDHYCNMVELFNDSDGEYGWPDYKETYNESCGE